MADLFPSNVRAPSFSPRGKVSADLLANKFEGYSQRTPNGLNYISEQWSVPWLALPEAEADILRDFLKAHFATPFLWTPPGESTALLVICTGFDRGLTSYAPGHYDVMASFEQVFDIV